MADETFRMGDQFKGLPMSELIGGPLMAACDAQVSLANATADFIKVVGFLPPPDPEKDPKGIGDARLVEFKFERPAALPPKAGEASQFEKVELDVPLLAIVKVPALGIKSVDVTFDMEVKSSESTKEATDSKAAMSGSGQAGWGIFSVKVSVSGSVSAHRENTRQTDKSAKYHVEVRAEDNGMPEGLARVLDMLNAAIAPKKITAPTP